MSRPAPFSWWELAAALALFALVALLFLSTAVLCSVVTP